MLKFEHSLALRQNLPLDRSNQYSICVFYQTMEEYTAKQVAEHNSPDDAWLIIHGQGTLQ